ncbi:MAG TPA: glycerol-3-phosphate dehydrogenase/oxidase [Desulfobacterales bacterium]|nr:glycerol-3-phosphate dehydrogenase/oxidase [Desulfobacterales bacterium]
MNRDQMIDTVENFVGIWDIIIIGGGATGLGTAVEAASRGYKTLLVEQHDFSKGTSSRSTKLIHGGIRYLQQGNISLVLEALHERGMLIQNAPHLVHNQTFIVPTYDWWRGPFYGVGMKVYDLMAGKLGLCPSRILSREETLAEIPTLEPKGLRGGVKYCDGQFDDSRLAINLAQTIVDLGSTPINYMKVMGFLKSNKMISGVRAKDMESGKEYELNGKVVINATGIFTDTILKMDNPAAKEIITMSQGVHLIFDKEFLPGDSAIMVPHTADGRVLFAVPWHNKVVVGTTETPVKEAILEPCAFEEEIDFILNHAAKYLTKDPTRKDVLSVFAGIRPLVNLGGSKETAAISRDHFLLVSECGLITITGGKWTTYRKMAEDTIDQAVLIAGLEERQSITKNMRIHGWLKNIDASEALHYYGSDAIAIKKLTESQPSLGDKLHERLPFIKAEVTWAVREEMARTVEDVLARRTRALLLDAKASMEMAPETAKLIAVELDYDRDWENEQVSAYKELAKNYLPA